MSNVLLAICSLALFVCAFSTPVASDAWEEASEPPICDLKRSLNPGGKLGYLDNTTCTIIEGGPTGSCCSPFHETCCGSKCSESRGTTIIAGRGDSATPTTRVDSCSADQDQVFSPIWSSSKMVSAAMIMKLVEQGRLDLDAPLSRYLNWWTADMSDPRARVALRHTLSMTDGFGQNPCCANVALDATGRPTGGVGSTEYTQEECAKKIYRESYGKIWDASGKGAKITGELNGGCTGFSPVNGTASHGGAAAVIPGAFWCYNEAHWTLTSYVAMAVTGRSTYQQLFEEVMGAELGISKTKCHWNWPGIKNVDAGGGLSCSVAEYSKFLGAYVSNSFLSKQSTEEMEKVHAPFPEPYRGFGDAFQISGYRFGMFQQWDPLTAAPAETISDGGNNGFLAVFQRPSFWAALGRDGDQTRQLGAGVTGIYGASALSQMEQIVASGGGNSDSCTSVCT